jgi:hypothetical protein
MTKFAIRQHKDRRGRFLRRADVWVFDRMEPKGFVYCECEDRDHARKVVAFEVEAFKAVGLPIQIIN